MQQFYYSQTREAEFFIPKLEVVEINKTIIRQLPSRVRESLASVDCEKTNLIMQTLANFDMIYTERMEGENKNYYRKGQDKDRNPPIKGMDRVENTRIQPYSRNSNEQKDPRQWEKGNHVERSGIPDTSKPPPNIRGNGNVNHLYKNSQNYQNLN